MAEVTIDATDVVERKADDRGRINLGTDLAGERVEVAVIEVKTDETDAKQG
jgi:hypothetical protein